MKRHSPIYGDAKVRWLCESPIWTPSPIVCRHERQCSVKISWFVSNVLSQAIVRCQSSYSDCAGKVLRSQNMCYVHLQLSNITFELWIEIDEIG